MAILREQMNGTPRDPDWRIKAVVNGFLAGLTVSAIRAVLHWIGQL